MLMVKLLRPFERTLFIFLKLILMCSTFAIFFFIYRPESLELQRGFNRVSAIISSTFFVVLYIMLKAYGGLRFGKKRTKELIISTAMVLFFTDVVTFMQFCIMEKAIMNFWLLIPVYIAQNCATAILTKASNDLYFKLNPPRELLVIHNNPEKLEIMLEKLKSYQNKFTVKKIMLCSDAELHRSIRAAKAVMLIDIPSDMKSYITEYCYKRGKEVIFTPEIADILINNAEHDVLDDVSVFSYSVTGLTFEQKLYKRIIDLLLSVPAAIILMPLMILEAVAIKLEDGGSVLYKQERITEGGKTFRLLKMRTMIENAENVSGPVLSEEHDKRITKVGSFLRKTRLDELPQLFNIIAGDMSIVGPRPERQEIAEEYEKDLPEFAYRLRVKAGLTGLAQIMGRYSTSPKDKLMLDLLYIEKYSMRLDWKIMFRTLVVILTPEKSK